MVMDVDLQKPQKSSGYEQGTTLRKKRASRDSKMCCCCCRFCCGAPTTAERIHAPVLHDASQIDYCRYWGRASIPPITSNIMPKHNNPHPLQYARMQYQRTILISCLLHSRRLRMAFEFCWPCDTKFMLNTIPTLYAGCIVSAQRMASSRGVTDEYPSWGQNIEHARTTFREIYDT